MALDLSLLSAYTEQKAGELVRRSLLGAKTITLVTKQYGIKSAETLNIIDGGTITAQADGCSFTPTGSTAFSQRTLTVAPIKFQEDICPKTLDAYYLQKFLAAGSSDEEFDFAALWTGMKADQIAEYFEKQVWQANVSVSSSLFNGFEQVIQGAASSSGSIRVDSGSAYNASSSVNIVNHIWQNIPAQVLDKDDLIIFMGRDALRTYQTGIQQLNLYHYDGTATGDSFKVVGGNVDIQAVNGLNGTNHIYAGRKSNFVFGTDILNDFEAFDVWYSKDFKTVRFDSAMKAGTQIYFPTEIAFYIG